MVHEQDRCGSYSVDAEQRTGFAEDPDDLPDLSMCHSFTDAAEHDERSRLERGVVLKRKPGETNKRLCILKLTIACVTNSPPKCYIWLVQDRRAADLFICHCSGLQRGSILRTNKTCTVCDAWFIWDLAPGIVWQVFHWRTLMYIKRWGLLVGGSNQIAIILMFQFISCST